MIYTVECSFADPASEAEWNDFYSLEKLPALISVSGFHTSQRFRALTSGCPLYLAIHSIDNLAVLLGEEYRQKGGGNFSRWQQHITNWHRNLYGGLDRAPSIGADEHLVISNVGPGNIIKMGAAPYRLQAVALERIPETLWFAKLDRYTAELATNLPEDIRIYAPMTKRLAAFGDAASKD